MSIASVVFASPTLLVVVIGLTFGVILWLVLPGRSSSKSADRESPSKQVPKRYQPAGTDSEDNKKVTTPDRRLAHLRASPPFVSCRD